MGRAPADNRQGPVSRAGVRESGALDRRLLEGSPRARRQGHPRDPERREEHARPDPRIPRHRHDARAGRPAGDGSRRDAGAAPHPWSRSEEGDPRLRAAWGNEPRRAGCRCGSEQAARHQRAGREDRRKPPARDPQLHGARRTNHGRPGAPSRRPDHRDAERDVHLRRDRLRGLIAPDARDDRRHRHPGRGVGGGADHGRIRVDGSRAGGESEGRDQDHDRHAARAAS